MKIKDLTGKFQKGSDVSRLLGNFIWLSLLQVAGFVFPLLTVPYLANVIGVDYFGEISFATALMAYFQTLVDYGFVFSAVRDIARCREDKEKVAHIYSKVMLARFFLVIVAFILLSIAILAVPKLYEMRWVLWISYLLVIGHAMFPEWMFQALEKMKYITIFNVAIKLVFTFAIFAFIRTPGDYLLQPLLTALAYILSGIGAMWVIHSWGIKIRAVPVVEIKGSLKGNFDLFLNQLVPNLYNSASSLILGFMHGNAANGVYGAANRFNLAAGSFFGIVSRTFYPFLSRRMDKHTAYRKMNLTFAILIGGGLFAVAPWLVYRFFPSSFDGTVTTIQILAVSLVFLALNNIYGTNYLILKGHERLMRQITLYSSLAGLCFAIPAIHFWSYIGVALTVTFARGVMGVWSWLAATRIERSERMASN